MTTRVATSGTRRGAGAAGASYPPCCLACPLLGEECCCCVPESAEALRIAMVEGLCAAALSLLWSCCWGGATDGRSGASRQDAPPAAENLEYASIECGVWRMSMCVCGMDYCCARIFGGVDSHAITPCQVMPGYAWPSHHCTFTAGLESPCEASAGWRRLAA